MAIYNLFIPLFNFEIDENLIGHKIICEYRILKSSDILYNPEQYFLMNEPFTNSFIGDITENGINKRLLHSYAKYVLFKQVEIKDNDSDFAKARIFYKKEIDDIILAFRLAVDGYCQVYNCYLLTVGHSACTEMQSSSRIDNICLSHRTIKNSLLVENLYHLNNKVLNDIKSQYNTIKQIKNKNLAVPIEYYHRCYDYKTPQDKILTLAIILESTLLAGKNTELSYRLFLRTSALLGKDVKNLLETFYSLRSDIIHNGTIQTKNNRSLYSKISKITGIKKDDYTELIFYFIKDYIEPIIREVLIKSFKIFENNEKIFNYEDLIKLIDEFVMKKISSGFDIQT